MCSGDDELRARRIVWHGVLEHTARRCMEGRRHARNRDRYADATCVSSVHETLPVLEIRCDVWPQSALIHDEAREGQAPNRRERDSDLAFPIVVPAIIFHHKRVPLIDRQSTAREVT